jgi:hypothetical protein
MIDTTLVIWQHLTGNGTSLYTLIGNRAWSPAAPGGWRNDSKAIIYEMVTEDRHAVANVMKCRVQFHCYGADDTYASAKAVYEALHDRLHGVIGVRVAAGQIRMARQIDGATGEREPETEWKYARAIYEIEIAPL